MDGVWHYYNQDGTVFEIVHFEHGKEWHEWMRRPPRGGGAGPRTKTTE
jgi:hypothetical protein